MTSSIKPEVHNIVMLEEDCHGHADKFGEDWTCSFGDVLLDRQTDRYAHANTLPLMGME